jgi:S-(hydroxymethyl)glutathione synthase
MRILETETTIDAPPQTVWSVLDDLVSYSEWNPLVPELHGLTVVGRILTGRMLLPDSPEIPLSPRLTRIIAARELRWLTVIPGDQGFTAEHYFILTPMADGGTHLQHNEIFDGPGSKGLWGLFDTTGRAAYNQFNAALKARATSFNSRLFSIHPSIDHGRQQSAQSCAGATTLRCLCDRERVEVVVPDQLHHNHLCGCSKCWKPRGALFAQTAVVAANSLEIVRHREKLAIVDLSQKIQRHACVNCGVHLYGRVADDRHHFYGVDFIHPELAATPCVPFPEFAGFVSSVVETGTSPSLMSSIRSRLQALGIPAYDAFSPEIMDVIAWHRVKVERSAE